MSNEQHASIFPTTTFFMLFQCHAASRWRQDTSGVRLFINSRVTSFTQLNICYNKMLKYKVGN